MITCTLRMSFASDHREEALQVLRTLVGPVRSHAGCTQTLLMSDVQNDEIITWVSRWRTRPDLDRHLRSSHFRRLLAVMELAAEPPDIDFECGTELRGLDLLEEVLGGGKACQPPYAANVNQNAAEGGIDP